MRSTARGAVIILIFSFIISQLTCSFAMDYKALHERADTLDLDQALADAQANPGSVEDLYILGLVYLNKHKDREAGEAFNKTASLDPGSIEAKWGRAEVWRRQDKIEESEKLLNEILEGNPDFAPALITMAYIQYTKTNFAKSVALARRVIAEGQDNIDLSNYTRAYLLVGGGKGMLASQGGVLAKLIHGTAVLPNLKKAEQFQPDSPAVLFGLGSFYFLAPMLAGGNKEKALDYLERAVKKDPLFADAYVRLAQIYKTKGEDEKSRQFLKKALEIDPDNALALDAQSDQCKFLCVTLEQ